MTPRDPDGKFTRSTPQQKLAAHVERVNAAINDKYPPGWTEQMGVPIPRPNQDWRGGVIHVGAATEDAARQMRENHANGRPLFQGVRIDEDFAPAKPWRKGAGIDPAAFVVKPDPSRSDAFLWLGILASLILVVLGWYLLAH